MTRTVSMSTAINEAMKISMRRDENVILIGEDVAGGAQLITCKMMKLGVVFLVLRKDLYKSLAEIVYWIHQFLKRVIWELRYSCCNWVTSDS